MKISCNRLRELYLEAGLIVSQNALGLSSDIKLNKLAASAKSILAKEVEPDLKVIEDRRNDVIDQVRLDYIDKPQTDAVNAQFRQELSQHPGWQEVTAQTIETWEKEVEFDFTPVPVKIKDEMSDKFKSEPVEVNEYGMIHKINPYTAFLRMIEEGFITVEE
ncbi:hypothetical protein [Dyadobacter sandarakinus]|uniref:Uncharacterized protein n=1 Tax=Dyadobacter sandarakinus TaxID=2747268 RepID=A0ABX7I1I0_9BACT|nr:hypothetical protein [Dyadobacter sandarakinus]QRQ99722.1 hypothetical protein HWI92_01720 [Dyadobacter sandarakinus]